MVSALLLAAAASWSGASWLGLHLGEPLTEVAAAWGDPLVATPGADVSTNVYVTDANRSFVTVLVRRGLVSGIRVWEPPGAASTLRDPAGIALGDSEAAVRKARGAPSRAGSDSDGPYLAYQNANLLWLYHLNGDGSVRTITVAATSAVLDDLPAAPLPPAHGGTSVDDAVVVKQSDGRAGVGWEHLYLAVHPCPGGGRWTMDRQKLVRIYSRFYDDLHAVCSSNGSARDFFFDATAYAGKI